MFNDSGCKDLTAFEAINNVTKEELELNKKVYDLIKVIKFIIRLAGFELVERLQIKDIKTGKEFR